MSIQEDLKNFYNAEASKYASTRKKHREDADIILDEIKNCGKKTISILEFGCGSGRLLEHLQTLKGVKIDYTGVDLSSKLLNIAKKNKKNWKFMCDDIVNYIKTCKQESFDFVIGIASFQHIPTQRERLILIKNIYRVLRYQGKLIMTNRALSQRFFKTYKTQILKSLLRYLITLGRHNFRDIMVPRKTDKKIYYRFYHLFSLPELKRIADIGGFTIQKLEYKNEQNSLLIAQKNVFAD